tara:strand:+ start:146 stop:829 length:684 start_codon:yes stop_codon:yes gene_type:complete
MAIFKNKCLRLVKNIYFLKKPFYLVFIPIALLSFSFLFKIRHQQLISQRPFDLTSLFRDISAHYEIPIYSGFYSTLGIFFFVSVFTICILTRNLLLKNKNKNKLKISFYKYACFLNFILLLDDQFLLHERGGYDIFFYFFYLAFVLLLISKLKKIILKKEIIYFVTALLFFFGSIIIDLNYFYLFKAIWVRYILEDIFKFIGIYYWLISFGKLSSRIIYEEIHYSSN